jgi:Protein of unknown function (DUF3754)
MSTPIFDPDLPEAESDVDALLDDAAEHSTQENFHLPGVDQCEKALPVRQGDLTRLLLAEPGLSQDDREKLEQVGRLLGAMYHAKFFENLRELKELYAPLDPDSDYVGLAQHSLKVHEGSHDEFLVPFESALERANYRQLNHKVIEEAISAPNEMGLTYEPDFSLFEHLRVYVRGFKQITREIRTVGTRFRKRHVTMDAYQRMVVALKFKPDPHLGPMVDTDVLYLRMFKDVPHVDMEMHLPEQGTRVRMRIIDKAQIASPLFTSIPALIVKYIAAAAISRTVLAGMVIAPISAGLNSFFGFNRAKQKHLLSMIHRLYYLTVANNASVLTRLIDSAEDEEYKEAMLAYFFLWRGAGDDEPWTVDRLDSAIEDYLREKTETNIDFEIKDALDKLYSMGLACKHPHDVLEAVPLDRALHILSRWDESALYP